MIQIFKEKDPLSVFILSAAYKAQIGSFSKGIGGDA